MEENTLNPSSTAADCSGAMDGADATVPGVRATPPNSFPVIRLQHLLDAGLNAFAAELLGESLAGNDGAIQVQFTLPIRKGNKFNAVAFQLTPLSIEEGNLSPKAKP